MTSGARRLTLSGLTVLLVEDELLIAMDIEAALEDRGATVRGPIMRLSDGVPLAENEDEHFDVAILDINLRGEEVYPIAERLKLRGVPFLFHTGHGEEDILKARFGEIPVCNKPVRTERLVDEVERLLAIS
ncbi:MAG: response regulator [Pacificimonas sp.]